MTYSMIQLMAVILLVTITLAQRPPYAGSRPTGYKNRLTSSTIAPTTVAGQVPLDNRFGAADASLQTTTQRLPTLALGDKELVDRLNQRPIDQRPFWLINAEAIEAQKNGGNQPAVISPVAASGFVSSINRPASTASTFVPLPIQSSSTSNGLVSNRFGEVNTPINSNNVISQQQVVYPDSTLLLVSSAAAPTSADRRPSPQFAQHSLLQPVQAQPQPLQVGPPPVGFFNGQDDYDDDYFN